MSVDVSPSLRSLHRRRVHFVLRADTSHLTVDRQLAHKWLGASGAARSFIGRRQVARLQRRFLEWLDQDSLWR